MYEALVLEVLKYIESNLENKLTLDIVANHFHMSKFYFHRIFAAVMGESLSVYMTKRRLNRAVSLIKQKSLSLTQISYLLDYSSQAAFSRSFKQCYGITPKELTKKDCNIQVMPIPQVISRDIKNYSGELISDFNIDKICPLTLKGIVFEVDLAAPNFKTEIKAMAAQLLKLLPKHLLPWQGPCYLVYSNCRPDSTRFNAIFGIPLAFECQLETVFEVTIPELLCMSLHYTGDLLEIGNLFTTDALKYLKVTKHQSANHHIELIQRFNGLDDLYDEYDVFVPIVTNDLDEA